MIVPPFLPKTDVFNIFWDRQNLSLVFSFSDCNHSKTQKIIKNLLFFDILLYFGTYALKVQNEA
jgi:hypothetical protein